MKADFRSRLLMALAALVMLPVFVSPLWTIRLVAPQYPEGLGMYIYVHDVQGHDRHDLQNINILNHYIGMQEINPEAIPELEIMPIILAGLIVTGLAVAVLGWPGLMAFWLLAFTGLGIAGLVDFYLWNIDYGHNLSPDAPIRIPDMTYSPPIIGSAQLLNIRASSWPHLGSLFLGLSFALASWATLRAWRGKKGGRGPAGAGNPSSGSAGAGGQGALAGEGRAEGEGAAAGRARHAGVLVPLLLFVAAGCGGDDPPGAGSAGAIGPASSAERMVYGEDEDPWCGELVEAVRWGGEIETAEGERLRFRSVECLVAFLLDEKLPESRIAAVRVVDFPDGYRLVAAESVRYLQTPNLASPTRLNLMAIEADKMQVNLQEAYAGRILEWPEVLEFVAREWGVGGGDGAGQ